MTGRALHSHHGVVTEWEGESEPPKEVLPPEKFTINEEQEQHSSTNVVVNNSESINNEIINPEIPASPEQSSLAEITPKLIFKSKKEKWIFFAFIVPPLAISFISMLHMISLFETSNVYWMALSIAIAVELAAMSSLIALVTLDKLNKTTVWSIFGVLAALQILGNMYHTFVNMSPEAAQTILNLLAIDSTPWSIRLVNFIVGGILPVISLTFVKGIVDYFKE